MFRELKRPLLLIGLMATVLSGIWWIFPNSQTHVQEGTKKEPKREKGQRARVTAVNSNEPANFFEKLSGTPQESSQAALDRVKLEPVGRLLQRALDYAKRTDQESLEVALMALAYSLKRTDDPNAARAVASVVMDTQQPQSFRLELLRQMILAGTGPSLRQILRLYRDSKEPMIRDMVVGLLPQLQGEWQISPEREDVTPGLVEAFGAEPDASPLLRPLAKVIAAFGTEQGVGFLMEQVIVGHKTIQEVEQSEDLRLDVSWDALRHVYRPDAIPALGRLLTGYDIDDLRIHVAGRVLAQIADKRATETVINYAIHAPVEFSDPVVAWLQHGNPNRAFLEALVEQKSFDSPEVKQALQKMLQQTKPQVFEKR